MKAWRCFLLGLAIGATLAAGEVERATPARPIRFVHEQAGRRVDVRCFVPAGAQPDWPVVFVLHGMGRNPEDCVQDWMPHAERNRFLLIVPEFSRKEFPGAEGYLYGNTVDRGGRAVPKEQWAFSAIEPIFDAVRQQAGNRRTGYRLYGFSAGAQFVQRFLYFVPEARVERAVAANAGWYTLPDRTTAFPYGLEGTPVTEANLRTALARCLILLLGDGDTDPGSPSLRHTPEADAQGRHRFARGQFFDGAGRNAAASLKTSCGWCSVIVPGVAHVERAMVPFAVQSLLQIPLSPATPDTP